MQSRQIYRLSGIYQVISNDWILGYNEGAEKTEYLYNYRLDTLMEHNLAGKPGYEGQQLQLEKIIKANIQTYNNAMIDRKLPVH